MTRLLVLSHSRAGSSERLAAAVVAGAEVAIRELDEAPVEVAHLDVTAAGIDDVRGADAVVFCTPARFGALAGLTKDLVERIYPWFDEVPDVRPGMPWTAVVKGATDPSGAARDLERILTGLRWKRVLPPLEVVGELTEAQLAAAQEVGATMAAGLATAMW